MGAATDGYATDALPLSPGRSTHAVKSCNLIRQCPHGFDARSSPRPIARRTVFSLNLDCSATSATVRKSRCAISGTIANAPRRRNYVANCAGAPGPGRATGVANSFPT